MFDLENSHMVKSGKLDITDVDVEGHLVRKCRFIDDPESEIHFWCDGLFFSDVRFLPEKVQRVLI